MRLLVRSLRATIAILGTAVLAAALTVAACSQGSSGGGGHSKRSGAGTGAGTGTGSSAGGAGSSTTPATPSDDPNDWVVDTTVDYDPVISAPTWVVPSPALPARASPGFLSNNNVAIRFHDGRLFLAWRTNETHFASANARIFVVSSADQGVTWDFEHEVAIGADVREPALISIGGSLILQYFEAGTNPIAFEPKAMWHTVRTGPGAFSAPATFGLPGEVPWDVKVRGGRAWMTSYRGDHYSLGAGTIDVLFQVSTDGLSWQPVDPARPVVYQGGVSEVGFELDETGELWAVTRNEDGDATGFGSHVATAPAADLAHWTFPATSDPERYDSPEMFRHGDDLYLVARRDLGGPFDLGLTFLPFEALRVANLAAYSLRAKTTTLYKIDRATRAVVPIVDLPGNGDTAFPSICRTGEHTFLLANYTSPLGNPDRTWISGQVHPDGTQIYLLTITFVPK